jgi:DnaJ-domain-containing protein 1
MLYPLEGRAEPTLIDRLVPRTSLEHVERARQWWLLYAVDVERFRASRPRAKPAEARDRPSVPPRSSGAKAGANTGRGPTTPAPPAPSTPRAILGVAANSTLRDVQRAWRVAVKRWHPDRIPTKDPVVLAEAHRRFSELRAAYEALTAELSG